MARPARVLLNFACMPQSDSGLIDLIAMDRDARAAEQQARQALRAPRVHSVRSVNSVIAETPSAAPMSRDIASSLSDDDLDKFAASMSSPWQRISRAKIAMAAGAVVVVLVGITVLAGGSGDSKAKAAAAIAAASTSTSLTPPAPSIPPPPPQVEATKPAAVTPAPPTTQATAVAAKSKPDKARRSTPSRKARSSGPKLTKVASSGVAP